MRSAAIGEALGSALAQQNDDGGWGTGQRRRRPSLGARRRGPHDSSTPDSTGRVLEALGSLGIGLGNPAIDRAVAYLRRRQEPDGAGSAAGASIISTAPGKCWPGLARIGLADDDPSVAAGANWLLKPATAMRRLGRVARELCRSAVPWARGADRLADRLGLDGPLLAAGLETHPAVARAVQYLVDTQAEDGAWVEEPFTGTGLPGSLYLRHHYYPLYFPLLAISRWAVTASATQATAAAPGLRVVMPAMDMGVPRAMAGL